MFYRVEQSNALYATPKLGLPEGVRTTSGFLFDKNDISVLVEPGYTYMPALRLGEQVPEDEAWRITQFIYLSGKVRSPNSHSLTGLLGFWIISEEFKDIVERLEPGRSQFWPVELRDYKTKEVRTDVRQYYFWNLLNSRTHDQVYDVPSMAAKGKAEYVDEPLGGGRHWRAWKIATPEGSVLMQPNALGEYHVCWNIPNRDVSGIQYLGGGYLECDEVFASEIRKLKYSGVNLLPLKMSDATS
ncbi:MAG: hypothetical protein ING71_07405 [Rhodocyclaceae bacterium]|nr:hypothetical protein [Rhodocyclaceae bacterium]